MEWWRHYITGFFELSVLDRETITFLNKNNIYYYYLSLCKYIYQQIKYLSMISFTTRKISKKKEKRKKKLSVIRNDPCYNGFNISS
jgi:hypothetical protein